MRIIGTCGLCGGRVTVPTVFMSIIPPTPTCESCGAQVAEGPVLPMKPAPVRRRVAVALTCWRCGTAAYQPNDRCDSHISWEDRLQTEIEHHTRKREGLREALLVEALDAVAAEEELSGPLPDHMRARFLESPEDTLRATVRATKTGIAARIGVRFAALADKD